MANEPAIVNLDDMPMEPYGKGDRFAAKLGRIGRHLGAQKLGCTLVALAPGKTAWPYHLHYAQEEMFVILEGEGTLRYDGAEHRLRAGDVVFTPPGPDTAHQIVNTADATLRYLALSSMDDPEVCEYPDSGKIGAYVGERGERVLTFLAPLSAATDYWDGEE